MDIGQKYYYLPKHSYPQKYQYWLKYCFKILSEISAQQKYGYHCNPYRSNPTRSAKVWPAGPPNRPDHNQAALGPE